MALPTTEAQYKAVHGRDITQAQVAELAQARDAVATLGVATSDIGAKTLRSRLERADGSYVVFVGHNERGEFKFADGSSESLSDIAEEARRAKKFPIFISCGSKRYSSAAIGIHRELGVSEALAATSAVMAFVQTHRTASPSEVQAHLSQFNKRYRVAYIVQRGCHAAAGLLVVAIILYLLSDDDEIPLQSPAQTDPGSLVKQGIAERF